GLYHTLARHGIDVSVHALRDGSASLYERIAERLRDEGAEVHTATAVNAVRVDAGGATVEWEGEGSGRRFAGVVLATPALVSARLLRGGSPRLREWLADVRYRPAVTLGLLLDRAVGARFF